MLLRSMNICIATLNFSTQPLFKLENINTVSIWEGGDSFCWILKLKAFLFHPFISLHLLQGHI